jgi:hypothetical protein
MGKSIKGNEGPVFGIFSSLDLYEKLKYESKRLENGWHHYDSFNFIVTAWHLYHDWIKSDDPKSISKRKRNPQKLPNSMRLVMDTVRDLANGSKHFQLDPKPAANRRIEEILDGNEVGWYQYFYRERVPGVTIEKHWYFSIRSLLNFIMKYFEWVFDDSLSEKIFPQDLDEAILYCNIANRNGKKAPTLYLKGINNTRHKSHSARST